MSQHQTLNDQAQSSWPPPLTRHNITKEIILPITISNNQDIRIRNLTFKRSSACLHLCEASKIIFDTQNKLYSNTSHSKILMSILINFQHFLWKILFFCIFHIFKRSNVASMVPFEVQPSNKKWFFTLKRRFFV